MPLHPKVEKMLANLARLELPPISETPVAEARKLMVETSQLLGPLEPVANVEDRILPGPAGDLPIRIYHPGGEQCPVVMYFHGGGWVIGSIESHDGYCRKLANATGAIIVSVEYRLAPEYRFPAATEDAFAATKWVSENIESLNGKPGPIGVAGDSAGGNLAATVCLMARDRNGPAIGCQVLIYPITDCNFQTGSYLAFAENYFLTRDAMIWFWNQYCPEISERTNPYVSPMSAESLAELPPALIVTAEFDPLRDEAETYAWKLEQAGVPTTLRRYEGMIHGFTRRFQLLDQAHQALAETVAIIQTHL